MKVSILGMGAFGIALTKIIKKDIKISMWTNFDDELKSVELKRENIVSLPGIKIDKKVELTTDLEKSVKNADVIFMAIPAVALREVSSMLSKYVDETSSICIVTKGIEKNTNKFMIDLTKEELKTENISIFSGPSFAIDMANKADIGMVIAADSEFSRQKVISVIDEKYINISSISDVRGVEIASSIKNVFAIICGMMEGMKLTDSTRASVLTLLLNDFRFIMGVLGGKETTVYSYAGIGDFLLTCMSPKSRNYTFGTLIGQGYLKDEAFNHMNVKTVEGLYTLDAIYDILKSKQVSVNSISLLYDVIYNNKKISNLLKEITL